MLSKKEAALRIIGGLDEVGTGSLAGPYISVVAVYDKAALTLFPAGVRDSKKTTEAQRNALYLPLCNLALDVGVGHAWPKEIDSLGPSIALQLCYQRAIKDLVIEPELLIVDGSNRVEAWWGAQRVEAKADNNYPQVSAASIIAKVFRDSIMCSYASARRAQNLPDYGWPKNKAYGTSDHIEAIRKYGLVVDKNDTTVDQHMYIHRLRYCRNLK